MAQLHRRSADYYEIEGSPATCVNIALHHLASDCDFVVAGEGFCLPVTLTYADRLPTVCRPHSQCNAGAAALLTTTTTAQAPMWDTTWAEGPCYPVARWELPWKVLFLLKVLHKVSQGFLVD